jgi:HEAT repeat protein
MPMRSAVVVFFLVLFLGMALPTAQEPAPGKEGITTAQVKAAIDKLGVLEFPVRMQAARTVRRAGPAVAVPLLSEAAASHKDGYVRFRALVLLSGFNDPSTREVMTRMLPDANDRLRTVAYTYFGHHPDPLALPRLLDALSKEDSEFVRPALTRALAAYGSEPKVRELMSGLVMRGQDFFRSAAIEAIGDHKGTYAFASLTDVAKLNGPLQDDAVLALGKLGDKRALETFAGLQRSASREMQPAVATAICLIGVNCASHQGYLTETIRFAIGTPGFQELLRGSANGLAVLAVAGNEEAARTLIAVGTPSHDPARAAIALALGTVALRNTPLLLRVLEKEKDLDGALELLREAFDMLEEDFEEERFFVFVRKSYWQAAAASPTRKVTDALIQKLEF